MIFTNAFALLVMPFLAAASPLVERTDVPCNSGSIKCCNTFYAANSTQAGSFASLLGIPFNALNSPSMAMGCTALSGIGLSDNSCHQQTVCCHDNHYSNVVVNVGCSPISL
ncbi:hypothetical protein CPB83DRAFT_662418 [Crepidotus variabilis]|uniref:Hydrophobin n=1 Tax=Crepidotus variabilis TaxID=179855 RepID=A0A9P6JTB4_9AGAR|nr:hypothetical protein CPB83DRAFT_662418 [Crepidotus variabilis]